MAEMNEERMEQMVEAAEMAKDRELEAYWAERAEQGDVWEERKPDDLTPLSEEELFKALDEMMDRAKRPERWDDHGTEAKRELDSVRRLMTELACLTDGFAGEPPVRLVVGEAEMFMNHTDLKIIMNEALAEMSEFLERELCASDYPTYIKSIDRVPMSYEDWSCSESWEIEAAEMNLAFILTNSLYDALDQLAPMTTLDLDDDMTNIVVAGALERMAAAARKTV